MRELAGEPTDDGSSSAWTTHPTTRSASLHASHLSDLSTEDNTPPVQHHVHREARRERLRIDSDRYGSLHSIDFNVDSHMQVHPAHVDGKPVKMRAAEEAEPEVASNKGELPERSLYLFTLNNPLRKLAIVLVQNKWFDRAVLFLILANCVFLAMDVKWPGFEDSRQGKMVMTAEHVFVALFLIEMILKVVAMGLLGKGAYLGDNWNRLDGIVVVLSLLPYAQLLIPSLSKSEGIKLIRIVRVLRPLRTVTSVEGMRKLVITLLESMPQLMDVGVLLSFAFFIFGIVGVQLFSGSLAKRCMIPVGLEETYDDAWPMQAHLGEPIENSTTPASWWLPEDEYQEICSAVAASEKTVRRCSEHLEEYSECKTFRNPNFGSTSFDNILWAWLTIFQCISLEGWTDVMYMLQDGTSAWVWLYFAVLIVFGAFFAVNLLLAVLYVKFTEEPADSGKEQGGDSQGGDAHQSAEHSEPGEEGEVAVTTWSNNRLVLFCFKLQAHKYFDLVTMSLIVLNTITMASDYDGMPTSSANVLEGINYGLTSYFAGEMFVKLIGLGYRTYCLDRMNIFDGLVVFFSFVEIIVNSASSGGSGGNSLSVLRSFRLLRVFKLARSWRQLNDIITTVFDSLSSISYLSLILLLFMFITALLGMQLFGYAFAFCDEADGFPLGAEYLCPPGVDCPRHFDCYLPCDASQVDQFVDVPNTRSGGRCYEYPRPTSPLAGTMEPIFRVRLGESYWPRHHFDDIYWSIVTIFQILTGENWNEVMYDAMRATSPIAALYFLFVLVCGNWVLLNLFLAILLDNFASEKSTADDDFAEEDHLVDDDEVGPPQSPEPSVVTAEMLDDPSVAGFHQGAPGSTLGRPNPPPGQGEYGYSSPSVRLANVKVPIKPPLKLQGNALGLLTPQNPLRKYLATILAHKHFEHSVIALICVSSIMLAVDSPSLETDAPDVKAVLDIIDNIFVVLFFFEMLLKVLVLGLVVGPGTYLRNSWNRLDFFIVIIGVFGMVTGFMGSSAKMLEKLPTSFLRALRTFRALRPIRMASRAEGMKVVVNALFQSFPGIANVALVCILFYLIFGILGLNLLIGQYGYCMDVATEERLDEAWLWDLHLPPEALAAFHANATNVWPPVVVTNVWCEQNGGLHVIEYPADSPRAPQELHLTWTRPLYNNFDNIGTGILTLVEIVTLEGWLDVMYNGVDARGKDDDGLLLHPARDSQPFMCLFFLLFIVVGSFFIWNLFVGVTIDKFNEMKDKQEGRSVFLTEEQRIWVSIQKLMVNARPLRVAVVPETGYRRVLYNAFNNDTCDGFIMAMIMLNVVVMAMAHRDMDDSWENGLFIANTTFAIIFLVEAAIKLLALRPKQYFADRWNSFDFVVVVLSMVSLGVRLAGMDSVPGLNLLRIFRIARVFRLIPKAKGLRTMFQTLLVSLPALGNVGSVLFLFFFIFAIMGMNLFGRMRQGEFLTRHTNFRDFPSALLVLFRMSTGESWNGIMHDCMNMADCLYVSSENSEHFGEYFSANSLPSEVDLIDDVDDQCSPDPFGILSLLFFWAFVILCAMVMLNLVIAVILENFQSENFENDTGDDDAENPKVGRDHVVRFQEVWSVLDPLQTYYITAAKLTSIIAELDAPLGVRNIESATKSDIQNIIMSCDIPNHNGKVHFYETLHALAGRKAGRYLPESEELKIRTKLKDRLPTFANEDAVPKYTAAHYHAALYVQAAVRGFLARYQLREGLNGGQGLEGGGVGVGVSDVGRAEGEESAAAAAAAAEESTRSVPQEAVAQETAVDSQEGATAATEGAQAEASPAEVAAEAAAPTDESSS